MSAFAQHAGYGEAMAVLAALIFAWTSIFFTTAGQRLGVTTVNLLRLPIAAVCLGVTHLLVTGQVVPANLDLSSTFWIGLSGVVGLAVGDSALFRSFTLIGPRRGMMMMAAAPLFTVVVAWILLDEQLGAMTLAGMAAVIAGVVLAVGGKDPGGGRFRDLPRQVLKTGFLLALVAAAGQGLGSAFAKLGMIGGSGADQLATADPPGIDPLGATLVRMAAAAVVYWLAVLPRHRLSDLLRPLRDRRGTVALAIAIFMGPYAVALGLVIFLAILMFRPQGLFGKA